MSVVVYQMSHSPFCIPITQALTACHVKFETREVPNWDRSPIIEQTNGAYYQVPLLVHDGRPIFESSAESQDVPRYVHRPGAGGRLFPERLEGLQAIVISFLEEKVEDRTFKPVDPSYLDGIMDLSSRVMTIRHKERKFGRGCVEQWRQDASRIRAEADALLMHFEQTLRHSPFLFGDEPVYADYLLFGIIGGMTFNGWNKLSPEQSALSSWSERLGSWRFPVT